MKNYIKPNSSVLPININENIANSGDYWDIHHNRDIVAQFNSEEEFYEYLRQLIEQQN